jgi:hypothetical protein
VFDKCRFGIGTYAKSLIVIILRGWKNPQLSETHFPGPTRLNLREANHRTRVCGSNYGKSATNKLSAMM